MRNVITVGFFLLFWLVAMVACNLFSVLLGLQHPSLPVWWLAFIDKGIPIVGLAVALAVTIYVRRQMRKSDAPH